MSFFDSFRTTLNETMVKTVNLVSGPLQESRFQDSGVLTPDEFVLAGDLLVNKCPTWAWMRGDPTKAVSYLPADKQFLITRRVPCAYRASLLLGDTSVSATVDMGEDDTWVLPTDQLHPSGDNVPEICTTTSSAASTSTTADSSSAVNSTSSNNNDDDDDDIPDMSQYDGENLEEEDPAALKTRTDDDNLIHTRTYDITICYDKYYQTPRVWLFGYDEVGNPLQPEQIFDDISSDHARKTVTLDFHPHLDGVRFAYIHPCRHAEVMKTFMARMKSSGKELRVDQYLLLFLKFISAVIPTIEYDYTMDIQGA